MTKWSNQIGFSLTFKSKTVLKSPKVNPASLHAWVTCCTPAHPGPPPLSFLFEMRPPVSATIFSNPTTLFHISAHALQRGSLAAPQPARARHLQPRGLLELRTPPHLQNRAHCVPACPRRPVLPDSSHTFSAPARRCTGRRSSLRPHPPRQPTSRPKTERHRGLP